MEIPTATEARQTSTDRADRIYQDMYSDLWDRTRRAISLACEQGKTLTEVQLLRENDHRIDAANRAAKEVQKRLVALGYGVTLMPATFIVTGFLRITWSEE